VQWQLVRVPLPFQPHAAPTGALITHPGIASDSQKPVQVIEDDISDPIARSHDSLYDIKSAFRGKPGVGAGVSRREYRGLAGETATETATSLAQCQLLVAQLQPAALQAVSWDPFALVRSHFRRRARFGCRSSQPNALGVQCLTHSSTTTGAFTGAW
jgi:hypothetical protein